MAGHRSPRGARAPHPAGTGRHHAAHRPPPAGPSFGRTALATTAALGAVTTGTFTAIVPLFEDSTATAAEGHYDAMLAADSASLEAAAPAVSVVPVELAAGSRVRRGPRRPRRPGRRGRRAARRAGARAGRAGADQRPDRAWRRRRLDRRGPAGPRAASVARPQRQADRDEGVGRQPARDQQLGQQRPPRYPVPGSDADDPVDLPGLRAPRLRRTARSPTRSRTSPPGSGT